MSEKKCPCCGESISEFEDSGFWECDHCPFMCALSDLPRIAAAMELAMAEVKLLDSIQAYAWYDQALIDRTKAREQVLEVFK